MSKNKYQIQYKKYLQASLSKGITYFQYEDFPIPINNNQIQNYQIINKIGRGKYSDVYKAINIRQKKQYQQFSVLKIMKPIRQSKIRRQIKILKTLQHQNIIELKAVMMDTCSKSYILAMDYFNSNEQKNYSLQQIKIYIHKILKGLDYCHSMGIMHRDIKPQNVVFDRQMQRIKIIDWGLADYYLPNKEYNVRVASRYYKGPQLLLNNKFYDYSLDIWSLGCMFASLLFQNQVMFKGDDNTDQLKKISQFFGTSDIVKYIQKYKLKPDAQIKDLLDKTSFKKKYFQQQYQKYYTNNELAYDLLNKMLIIDHKERITALQALTHPFFNNIKK